MQKLTFTNTRGESIIFGNSAPFILSKIEGTGGVETEIQTTKAPFQDGSTLHDVILGERSISIEGAIFARTPEEMYTLRKKLSKILNPKYGQGLLRYENDAGVYEIKVIAEESPNLKEKHDNSRKQLFIINFLAANPFWLDDTVKGEEITTWIGGLKFSLILPVKFATRGPNRKNIINHGDVDTPVEITFRGPATNPKVLNQSTGEFIKINRALESSDKLIISTEFGNKRVEIEMIDGTRVNAFNWIDLESTFWQLRPGDNIIEYSSDNQTEPAEVSIKYYNRFVGV